MFFTRLLLLALLALSPICFGQVVVKVDPLVRITAKAARQAIGEAVDTQAALSAIRDEEASDAKIWSALDIPETKEEKILKDNAMELEERTAYAKKLAMKKAEADHHLPEPKEGNRLPVFKENPGARLPDSPVQTEANTLPSEVVSTPENTLPAPPPAAILSQRYTLPALAKKKPKPVVLPKNVYLWFQSPVLGCNYCMHAVNACAHAGPQPMMNWCRATQGLSGYLCQLIVAKTSHSFAAYTKGKYSPQEIWSAASNFAAYGDVVCSKVCEPARKLWAAAEEAQRAQPGIATMPSGPAPSINQQLLDPQQMNPDVQRFTYGSTVTPSRWAENFNDGHELQRRQRRAYDERFDKNLVAQAYGGLHPMFQPIEENPELNPFASLSKA